MTISEIPSCDTVHHVEVSLLDQQKSPEINGSHSPSTPLQAPKSSSLGDSLNESKEYWVGQVEKYAGTLSKELRIYLVTEIHRLLDIDDWEEGDVPPTQKSIQAFMKLLIGLNPEKFPGIYFDYDGRIVMDWRKGKDKAYFECYSRNWIKCYISIRNENERFLFDRNDTLSKIIKETTKLSLLYEKLLTM